MFRNNEKIVKCKAQIVFSCFITKGIEDKGIYDKD